MEVWGDEDKLEEAKEQRVVNKEKAKKKKFDKRVKGKIEQSVNWKEETREWKVKLNSLLIGRKRQESER